MSVERATNPPLFESDLKTLSLMNRGKVRDIYAIDEAHMLIVATDRLSAFDVVLSDPIPGKGAVLTALSNFWFARMTKVVANHLSDLELETIVSDPAERAQLEGRSSIVRKLKPLPVEAIVRGYLIGSGWKDYKANGMVCGIPLAKGLNQADRLPEPIYTPSTKAEVGEHDENISFERTVEVLGKAMAERIRDLSLQIYNEAADYALTKGIIIADTKFEFGADDEGELYLIDEVLTPDSSRFWPADSYQAGTSPPSFDKQYVRDYLESLNWNKEPPAPKLPTFVVQETAQKYSEVRQRLGA